MQVIKDDDFEGGDCAIEGSETVPIGDQGMSLFIVSLKVREGVSLGPLCLICISNNRAYISGRAHTSNRLSEST